MLKAIEAPSEEAALVAAAEAELDAAVAEPEASPAQVLDDLLVVPSGLDVSSAHAFADPPEAVASPDAYSFALYKVSTGVLSLVAHCLADPVDTVVPIACSLAEPTATVVPTAYSFDEYSPVD